MKLTSTNLIKILVLHLCKENEDGLTVPEIYAILKNCDVEDVSVDLLSKTLQNMILDGTLEYTEGKYKITEYGFDFSERNERNLSLFVTLLISSLEDLLGGKEYSAPEILDKIVAFKTVPYQIDSFEEKEEEFFRGKILKAEPYRFEGRGLGRSRFAMEHGLEPYDYENYAILFFNAGLIQYIGFVEEYNNFQKEMMLSSVIRLKNPVSILDIRENVRDSFNSSQQKQEFFEEKEVLAMKEVLKMKASHYGYETFTA